MTAVESAVVATKVMKQKDEAAVSDGQSKVQQDGGAVAPGLHFRATQRSTDKVFYFPVLITHEGAMQYQFPVQLCDERRKGIGV